MNAFLPLSLQTALERARAKAPTGTLLDVSKGMAILYFRNAPVGAFTVVFCESWCANDPEYRWVKL